MTKKIPKLTEVQNELSRRSYKYYVKHTHRSMYIESRFSTFITELVQSFIEKPTDKAYEILCISVPPQHGKSMQITETLPSWILGKFPNSHTIMASYNEVFASKFLRKNSRKLEQYSSIFNIKILKDSAEALETDTGTIISRGLMSGITGNPANFVIIDDPIKNRKEARSETTRDAIYDEWLNSVKTRLAPGAKVIVIQTRWHKEDLIGKLLATEKNIKYINFPVECLKEHDEMGRVKGELLCPEIGRDTEWWNDFKQSYMNDEGSEALNSLYYGNPTNAEGGIFKREWFRYWTRDRNKLDDKTVLLPEILRLVISVDATFKDTSKSDKVAITTWGKTGVNKYCLHITNKRLSFTETLKEIERIIQMFPHYDEIEIEDKANGSAIIDVLRKKYSCIIPITPKESKEARASAIAPEVESGTVFVEKDKHMELVDQCVDFPNTDHDDLVDSMSQALNRLRNFFADFEPTKVYDYEDEIESILDF